MNDLRNLIAQLERPSPSTDLDERIGKVVMEAEWGIGLTKKLLLATPLILLLGVAIGLHFFAQSHSLGRTGGGEVVSNSQNPESYATLVVEAPELTSLVIPTQLPGEIWGTKRLSFQVELDDN